MLLLDGSGGSGCLLVSTDITLAVGGQPCLFITLCVDSTDARVCVFVEGVWPRYFWAVVKVLTLHGALSNTTLAFKRLAAPLLPGSGGVQAPRKASSCCRDVVREEGSWCCPPPYWVFSDTIQAGRRRPSYSLMKVRNSVLSTGHLLSEEWVE